MEAINVSIHDDRVNEIIICDDNSNDIIKLEKIINDINSTKIKLYKNQINLGCYHNKIETISKCTNEWAILLDSDNVIGKDYIDTLFNITEWEKNIIYHPCWAKTFPSEPSVFLDFRCYNNTIITKTFYLNNFNNNNFQCLINNCNYFLPVNSFIKCMNQYKDIHKREEMDVLDSAVLFTDWLLNNNNFIVVENLIYGHRLHPNSNYMLSPSHKHRDHVLKKMYDSIKKM
jgi:glycosyltransferase involved in cell wall biosynthesis